MKFPKTIILIALILAMTASTGLSAAPTDKTQSFILKQDADFWTLKDGTMVWVEKLGVGQFLEASKSTEKGKYNGVEYVLAKVKLDSGKDGYVIDSYVARNAVMGVVTSTLATLYKEARDASVTELILPVANIVALWPVSGKTDFYKVSAWNEEKKTIHTDRFISAADVSVNERDINVALLLKAMAGMKKPEQRKKILSTIDSKYPNSAFTDLVEKARLGQDAQPVASPSSAASTSTSSSSASTASLATQKSVQYWVATAPLNIRKEPNTQSEVVLILDKGDYCSTSEFTAEMYSVGGKTARWYKTVQPAIGWVFGAFLEQANEN